MGMDARVATLRATTATPMIRAVMNARARGVVLQHQLQRRRQLRREVVATKMDARVATLRVTIATPSPRARMNARERGAVLIPTRRQPWCRARSLSQPLNRLQVVATTMDARVATLRATTATPMIRAVMNARERGVVLQHQLQRRRQRRREVVATKMDARVATLRVTTATPSPRARMNARGRGARIDADWCDKAM